MAHNYKSFGPPLTRGSGVHVWDVVGAVYLDCLAGFSALNQGHSHPRIVEALNSQSKKLGLVSRGLRNDILPRFAQQITALFGYDKMMPASTGMETGETACKLARRWGYDVKGIPADAARIVFAAGNFWGRSIAAVSSSTDPSSYGGFGPLVPGFHVVPYDDVAALETALSHPHVCAFMVEPVQGEAGVIVPRPDYLLKVKELCRKHRVLFIADEVQTGLGRAGHLSAASAAGAKPDILCLGKALGGGVYPVSAVLCDDAVMLTIQPGQHGSTWGGNAIASAVGMAALDVIIEEKLCQNSLERGAQLRKELSDVAAGSNGNLVEVRGQGLLNAVVVAVDAWSFCEELARNGVLSKPTTERVIRLAPPLCITAEQISQLAEAIEKSLKAF